MKLAQVRNSSGTEPKGYKFYSISQELFLSATGLRFIYEYLVDNASIDCDGRGGNDIELTTGLLVLFETTIAKIERLTDEVSIMEYKSKGEV